MAASGVEMVERIGGKSRGREERAVEDGEKRKRNEPVCCVTSGSG